MKTMTDHACYYYQCPEPGTIHIGVNGKLWQSLDLRLSLQTSGTPTATTFSLTEAECEMQELGRTSGGRGARKSGVADS